MGRSPILQTRKWNYRDSVGEWRGIGFGISSTVFWTLTRRKLFQPGLMNMPSRACHITGTSKPT